MGRHNRKSATKKRQKVVIEFDERKRAYVKDFTNVCRVLYLHRLPSLYETSWPEAMMIQGVMRVRHFERSVQKVHGRCN